MIANFVRANWKLMFFTFAIVMVVAIPSVGVFASASGVELDVDSAINELWQNVNNNLPWVMGIVGIGAGISIAIALANFIVRAIFGAFRGG